MKKFCLVLSLVGLVSTNAFGLESGGEADCFAPGVSPIGTGELEIGGVASGFYAFADFTYWYNDLQGMTITAYNRTASPEVMPLTDQKARPGFKVGLGFFTPSSDFDVNAQYTWFYNKQNKNQFTSVTLAGTDLFSDNFQTVGGSFASIFNRIDLTIGKDVFFGKYFAIAPGGGFFGIWGNFWYNALKNNPINPGTYNSVNFNNHQNFWGVGPYFNFKAEFLYPYYSSTNSSRFVFFMQPGLGFAWAAQRAYYNKSATGSTAHGYAVIDAYTGITCLLDGVIGVTWEVVDMQRVLSNFAFTVAWEIQHYQDLNIIQDQGNVWNWALQGLTTGLNFRF